MPRMQWPPVARRTRYGKGILGTGTGVWEWGRKVGECDGGMGMGRESGRMRQEVWEWSRRLCEEVNVH